MNEAETRGDFMAPKYIRSWSHYSQYPKETGRRQDKCKKIISTKTDINPKFQGGQLTIEVNTRSEMIVVESTSKMNLTKTKK
ncbi:hypothetical protein GCM10020331_005730 [Ectobacillus funiculus]